MRQLVALQLRTPTETCIVNDMNTTHPTIRLRLDIVRELREAKGLEADRDLAAAMSVNQSSVSRVLRGVSQPGPRFIAALCAALETPMSHLFAIDDGKEKVA